MNPSKVHPLPSRQGSVNWATLRPGGEPIAPTNRHRAGEVAVASGDMGVTRLFELSLYPQTITL